MVWRNPALQSDRGKLTKSSKAVTDADENMVRIPSTDDSDVKLNVAPELEPWSSIALTSFL